MPGPMNRGPRGMKPQENKDKYENTMNLIVPENIVHQPCQKFSRVLYLGLHTSGASV